MIEIELDGKKGPGPDRTTAPFIADLTATGAFALPTK